MVFSYRKSIPTAESTTKCGGSDIGWRVGTFKTLGLHVRLPSLSTSGPYTAAVVQEEQSLESSRAPRSGTLDRSEGSVPFRPPKNRGWNHRSNRDFGPGLPFLYSLISTI